MRRSTSHPREEEVLILGTLVRYSVGGAGPTVLLLHGWGGDRTSWGAVPDDLIGRGFRVIWPDLPGFGASPLPAAWDVAKYAASVRELLLLAGGSSAAVIGHSFGGRIAIVLAATWPDLVTRLVLAASAGIRVVTPRARAASWALRALSVVPPALVPPRFRAVARRLLYRFAGAADYLAADDTLRSTLGLVVREDLRDYARRIVAPTLLIWGDRDRETPLALGRKLARLIPDSGLVIFEGAGHFCYLEQFARWSIVVGQFLSASQRDGALGGARAVDGPGGP